MKELRPPKHYRVQPRGLCRVEAADYIGVSPSLFDQLVADGRMPAPKRINSRNIWDVRQLDIAFEGLPSDDKELNDPFQNVHL
jgi:predicted DNA-binding transcriptional regulator AlpA